MQWFSSVKGGVKVFLLMFFLVLMGACQSGESEYDTSPQGNLDALWTLIDEHYCFLTYKEKELGFKWADIHSKYSAKLNPEMTRVQLFEVLCQMLSELKDGHVNISTSLDLGRNWTWKEDYPENLDTELRQQHYLGTDYHIGTKTATDIIDRDIAGKTWRERVQEYFENGGTEADITRIAETEAHRDSNEAAFITAKQAGATKKVWHCLMLPTSRDSHIYLDGVSAPIDGLFYSINGGATQFPSEWGIPEEDINCYCFLTYSK